MTTLQALKILKTEFEALNGLVLPNNGIRIRKRATKNESR